MQWKKAKRRTREFSKAICEPHSSLCVSNQRAVMHFQAAYRYLCCCRHVKYFCLLFFFFWRILSISFYKQFITAIISVIENSSHVHTIPTHFEFPLNLNYQKRMKYLVCCVKTFSCSLFSWIDQCNRWTPAWKSI